MRLIASTCLVSVVMAMAFENQPNMSIKGRQDDEDEDPVQTPAETPKVNEITSHGCYSSLGELEDPGDYVGDDVSIGLCQEVCDGSYVTATKGSNCYCGDTYPPSDDLVDDENCDFTCPGYGLEICGGINSSGGSYYSVYNLGVEVDVKNYEAETTTATSSTEAATSTAISSATTTVETTAAAESSGGVNVAVIAGGVAVGVVAIAGIAGFIYFFMRRKRNKEIEEEHRRNAAANSFMGHKPTSSCGISITDARLDPDISQRRLSTGSIADDQDYSRKILRVTNA